MEGALKLSILSPERKLLAGVPVEQVSLTGSEGLIEILPEHAPILGTLETGLFLYKTKDGAEHTGIITTGFFELRQKDDGAEVTVLADVLELSGEIDVERAKRAQKKAEDALKDANLDESNFRKYQLKLERSLIRQQVAGREFPESH